MASKFNLRLVSAAICAAAAGGFVALPVAAQTADSRPAAADKAKSAASQPDRMAHSDRVRAKQWSSDKDMLKGMLKTGQDRAYYAKTLGDNGYQITSVNVDKPDKLEYEVVKGAHSYEVQIDFDKAAKATKIDVDANMWRADATKSAMRGAKLDAPPAFVNSNERYSDRARMKDWTGEKERLEKALTAGQDKAGYAAQLKKLGYQVTAINDSEKDYVEYEIVKGSNTYEVQIDLEGGKGKKVDVTSNLWQAEATEKALAQSGKSSKSKSE